MRRSGHFSDDPASTLQFVLDQNWTSPVGFASGLTPSLSGALDLEFANGVDPSALVGDTFQLFNWSAPLPPDDQFSSFATAPGLTWDLSNLYTTGSVTLTAVPEPSALILAVIGSVGGAMFVWRRRPGRVKSCTRTSAMSTLESIDVSERRSWSALLITRPRFFA